MTTRAALKGAALFFWVLTLATRSLSYWLTQRMRPIQTMSARGRVRGG